MKKLSQDPEIKKLTPQEWKEIEKRLESFYEFVELICDGYKITLILERASQFRNKIRVYVDGQIKGIWYTDNCEERRRFFRPVKKFLNPKKWRDKMKKEPKWLQKRFPDTDKTYTYYLPDWLSFGALKSHLIKNNSQIELMKTKE